MAIQDMSEDRPADDGYRKPRKAPFGRDRDIIKIHGDIVSPMPAEWFGDPENTEGHLL